MKLDQMKIVTGGAQGMGRHFALRLAEAGAQAVGDVIADGLASFEAEAKAPGKVPRASSTSRARPMPSPVEAWRRAASMASSTTRASCATVSWSSATRRPARSPSSAPTSGTR
jgi:NAD(P)-dependent dehydrogenase (short-subunit alcohol dehydrogenase family)